jgi:hypothetical protein
LQKPLGELKPNCPGMIIGRFSVFYADRKSKMAATTGHSINTEPYNFKTSHFRILYSFPSRISALFLLPTKTDDAIFNRKEIVIHDSYMIGRAGA